MGQKNTGIGSFSLPASPIYGLSYSVGGRSIVAKDNSLTIGVSGAKSGDIDDECALTASKRLKRVKSVERQITAGTSSKTR